MEIPLWRSLLFFALLALFGIALFPTSREMGLLYVQNRSFGKARAYLAKQFHHDPTDVANAVRYLQSLLYDGEYHRFEELSSKLVKNNPDNLSLHLICARFFESMMNEKKASKHWEWLLRYNPQDADTRDKLLSYYLLNKLNQDYCRISEQEIAINPLNPYLYSDLGDQYLHLKETQKAEAIYLKMEKLFPLNPEPYQKLAQIYESQGNVSRALEYYQILIEKFPENEEFATLWVDKLMRYRKPEAQSVLEKYAKQFPRKSFFIVNLASVYQKQGKNKEAIQLLETYSQQIKDDLNAIKLLADLYFDNRDFEKSLRFLKQYHEKTGGDYHSHHVLGDVLVATGQRTAGREEYRKALELLRSSF